MKYSVWSLVMGIMCAVTVYATGTQIIDPYGNRYDLEMINPVVHEATDLPGIAQFFHENGYVVVDHVSHAQERDRVVTLIDRLITQDIPALRRLGFLDLYHDDSLAQLRQNPALYKVFTALFGTEKLWVVFDRVIYQTPQDQEEPLPAHVDQNPVQHPHFFNVQAMLALRDMDEHTGTLALIPKSPLFFQEYAQWSKPSDGYVEYNGDRTLNFVGLRLQEGQLVIWDSRTTHSRYRGQALHNRYAALLTFTQARDDADLVALRMKYFTEGIGWYNHDAGLRATARPRCTVSVRQHDEQLTALGRKLYGLDSWFKAE